MDFLTELDPLLRTFWFVAIPATVIFAIQTIMTFVGVDSSEGLEADFDSNLDGGDAPFQLFSFRNLINFLLGFGWAGISFYGLIQNKTILILAATIIGVAFVYVFFLVISQILKLGEDGSFKMSETLSKIAEVYLTIPAHMEGRGKILISVKGSMHELEVMTKGEKIPSGSTVKIVSIENGNVLIVEKI